MASPTDKKRGVAGRDEQRLQKHLADQGFGSRRELEKWIEAGRVSVNGLRATLGQKVSSADVVRVDGRKLNSRPNGSARVLLYHKSVGEICARSNSDSRPSVFDQLPRVSNGRWINIGRLDLNTSGLLLFTNEGELAHRLMHPSRQIEREYAVRIRGEVSQAMMNQLRKGVALEDGPARFNMVSPRGGQGVNQWFHVVLCEGRTREVRRLWESQGVQVSRLIRVRYGPVSLGRRLRAGHWAEAESAVVRELRVMVGLQSPVAPVNQLSTRPTKRPPRKPPRRRTSKR